MSDWQTERANHEKLLATDLGKLWWAYHNATIDYWRYDNDESISPRRLSALDAEMKQATALFKAKLMELAGVK